MKKVAIIGAGPAGIEAASILARNGVEVTLFEKSETPLKNLQDKAFLFPNFQNAQEIVDDLKPFYVSIFYRYFVHKAPASFRQHHAYANLMDALLLYVFLGLTMAIIKIFWSKVLGMRRTTKHTIVDRFSKFSLWMIFPLRLLAESVTACLYGNGGFFTQAVGNLFDPMIVRGLETSLWMFYSLMLGVFFVTMPFTRYMHIFTELMLIYFRKIGVREEKQKTGYTYFELNACSRCGVCISGCPMDKVLENHDIQSVYLIRSIRNQERASRINIIADNCLMCDRCTVDCPVGIDLSAIRRMSRDKGTIDTTGNYTYLAGKQNPFNAIGRVAYFGGCMSHLTGGDGNYRRVLLKWSKPNSGAFSPIFPSGSIELVKCNDREPRKIFEGRYWGDPGFIQICFDVTGMDNLAKWCKKNGHPFTVDSCPDGKVFNMGDASGRFTYIEDPDGTLIEFVETYRISVAKKLGWYINLLNRKREKPLCKLLFRAMKMNRKKF